VQLVEALRHKPEGIDSRFLIGTMAPESTEPLRKIDISNISWRLVLGANNLSTFMCRLSGNLGASASWNLHGLFRPVQELLCPKLKVP
jgi:hypothetical protein